MIFYKIFTNQNKNISKFGSLPWRVATFSVSIKTVRCTSTVCFFIDLLVYGKIILERQIFSEHANYFPNYL